MNTKIKIKVERSNMERLQLVVQQQYLCFEQLCTMEAKERYSIVENLHRAFLRKVASEAQRFTLNLDYYQAKALYDVMGDYIKLGYGSLGAIYMELGQKLI